MAEQPAGGPPKRAVIHVLAGVNGAGKSSIAGAFMRVHGSDYYNPDEATGEIQRRFPLLTKEQANARAWQVGKEMLERALERGAQFAFETTLGGRTITETLLCAARDGRADVSIWYAGLESVELHVARVAQRVAKGGHDIPLEKIRARYAASHANLVRLIPHISRLHVVDNSAEADPGTGSKPIPRLILEFADGKLLHPTGSEIAAIPTWAKAMVVAAVLRFANKQ